LQGTALTYSLPVIIKERRFLNNPERVWDKEDIYNYFILYDKYVLKFHKNKSITWPKIKQLFEDVGINTGLNTIELPLPSQYRVEKKLTSEIQKLIFDHGMAFYP
jgi:hypothetical protein